MLFSTILESICIKYYFEFFVFDNNKFLFFSVKFTDFYMLYFLEINKSECITDWSF